MEQTRPSVKWFIDTQSQWFMQNGIPEWFHGVITRRDAEDLLKDKTPGCFLIRVSESRIGYSLSYRTLDRYRHFMIDVLPDQQCIIAGDTRVHSTLEELVKFHKQYPLNPYNEFLTLPCGQKKNSAADYEELFDSGKPVAASFPGPLEASIGAGATTQPHCPPLPPRRCHIPETSSKSIPSCNLPPTLPGNRLYPALPTELVSSNTDFVLPTRHPPMLKARSFDSATPTAAHITNSQIKKEDKQKHAPGKPLKACRNAMTKAVSVVKEGEIIQDFKKIENAVATHLKGVKENFDRFGHTGQKVASPTPQKRSKHTKVPDEYKAPPPFAPGFC